MKTQYYTIIGIEGEVTPVDGETLSPPQLGLSHGMQHFVDKDGNVMGSCGTWFWDKNAKPVDDVINLEEKVAMYEGLLHDIQMHASVTMNSKKVQQLIDNICAWSYAHREGNGELSEHEQQQLIDEKFRKLRHIPQ